MTLFTDLLDALTAFTAGLAAYLAEFAAGIQALLSDILAVLGG